MPMTPLLYLTMMVVRSVVAGAKATDVGLTVDTYEGFVALENLDGSAVVY